MDFDDLTVIVPTKNEERNIGAFLGSLPPSVPLVVVDASDDSTPALVMALRPARTQLLRHPGNIAQARQAGAQLACTPWLLFTDADVTFAPGYFDRLGAYAAADAVYGPKLSAGAYVGYYRRFSRGQQLLGRLGIPAASGSNLLVGRNALAAVGGFDATLSCNEDSELVWRIQRNGLCVRFAPDLIVYAHDHRRLQRGCTRKTLHSLVRCALLFSGLMPDRWRRSDWGYWKPAPRPAARELF